MKAKIETRLESGSRVDALTQRPRDWAASYRMEDEHRFPVTVGQQRIWFLSQLAPGSGAYNLPVAARICGSLDYAALREALDGLVRRHAALRTTFYSIAGVPYQRVNPPTSLPLREVDLRGLTASARVEESSRLLEEEAIRPFDLTGELMVRAVMLRMAEAEWIFCLNFHHMAADGWSIGILAQELAVLYEALVTGRRRDLPPLPLSYVQYAAWQHDWLNRSSLDPQVAFWKNLLRGAPSNLDLPSDRSRPAVETYRGSRRHQPIPAPMAAGLYRIARKELATPFMAALSAFVAMMYRLSCQPTIVVGTPISGRNWTEVEPLVGLFANTLALRADLDPGLSFRELLRQLRSRCLDAYAHQEVPFERVVEAVHPKRDLSQNPIFQVSFSMGPGLRLPDLHGLQIEPLILNTAATQFDLSLFWKETVPDPSGVWIFSTDLFDASTVESWAKHFGRLLEGVVSDPDRPLARLDLLAEEERNQILVDWNPAPVESSIESTAFELIAEQMAAGQDRVAVECEGECLTFGDMEDRISVVAEELLRCGLDREGLVGVCLERCVSLPAVLLGIWRAGAAYLPLDPQTPVDRLAFMLKESRARVIMTSAAHLSVLSRAVRLADASPRSDAEDDRHKASPILVDVTELWGRGKADLGSGTRSESGNLAYVIFTSGSTGEPKGVAVEHASVTNLLLSMKREPGLGSDDVLLAVTPLTFDIASLELLLPLVCGGKVVLASESECRDPNLLAARLRRSGATVMQSTPSRWRWLINGGWGGQAGLRAWCGGEALSRPLADLLLPRVDSLWNLYGPTETTIWSLAKVVGRGPDAVSIGRPIANTRIYLLDPQHEPVLRGVPGEIYIGGSGVARGYIHRPDLSGEKFLPDPYAGQPGARMYATGDLARLNPEGELVFLGRADTQVKIRGFRIELGEIEAVLRQHPSVGEAVVVNSMDSSGVPFLAAYFTPLGPSAVTPSDLREYLSTRLPQYMVPSAWVGLPSLPVSPNGKVDRRALPAPGDSDVRDTDVGSITSPTRPLEYQLQQLWEKALQIRPVGVDDDFFDLGGHSLLAASLFAEIGSLMGQPVPLVVLFQAPTIRQLAAWLSQKGWSRGWDCLVPLKANGSRPPWFVIHAHGGNLLSYRDLVRHLPADQPAYGLQARGLNGAHSPHESITSMAASYVLEIKSLQFHGPYHLCGYCSGGLIALEMARMLHLGGDEVGALVLLDTMGPFYQRYPVGSGRLRRYLIRRIQEVQMHWWNLLESRGQARMDYAGNRAKKFVRYHACRLLEDFRRLAGFRGDGHPATLLAPLQAVQKAILRALRNHTSASYAGRTLLVRAEQAPFGAVLDQAAGWTEELLPHLTIRKVPGYPGGIVYDPQASHVVDLMTKFREGGDP